MTERGCEGFASNGEACHRRALEAQVDRLHAKASEMYDALREWQRWAAERDFDEGPPEHLITLDLDTEQEAP